MTDLLPKKWILAEKLPQEINLALGSYPEPIRQILYNRGCRTGQAAEMYLTAGGQIHDPFLLKDMDRVVDRLEMALKKGEPIAIYGDYDVDGVTATVLLVEVLRALGGEVAEYIPNRFDEGYGLNVDALGQLADKGIKVVVTVDCGIRSPNEAEYARVRNIDLIISDHHHPRGDLPNAFAVICQKQEGDTYPNKNLAGVGLAYKIAQALVSKWKSEELRISDWLDLVALGTIADIVPLVDENRALVRAGLGRIRGGQRPGLFSLANVSGLDIQSVTATDIGFMLGPRLNASGRLDTALDSFRLLISKNMENAAPVALKLDSQNKERQKLTQETQLKATEKAGIRGDEYILFAVDEHFNEGIVGLAAAKLTEAYYRPAIVGKKDKEFTRASCRSIPEFHITAALDECAELLVRHGGHAMAAGFTVRNENLNELISQMSAIASRELSQQVLQPKITADVGISFRELKPELLYYLDDLQPTGLGNPEALFMSTGLKVQRFKAVGSESKHLKLIVSESGITFDAIAFRKGEWALKMPEYVDLMYSFEKNEYNGFSSLQLNVKDLHPSL